MSEFQFSGHETFPLRQLWLMKAVKEASLSEKKSIEESMIDLGVGKNMVASIRFWGKASGMVDPKTGKPSIIGHSIFGDEHSVGLDPYGESLNTAWLAHWNLTKQSSSLTAFWFVFNYINKPSISRAELQEELSVYANNRNWKVSSSSIKRDIEVFLRSYVPNLTGRNKQSNEEFVEPLLGDLGLLSATSRDTVSFHRSERATLPNALFAYCLLDYWNSTSHHTATLDLTKILHGIGAPGKVFRLTENSIVDRLSALEELTNGELLWTEQGGVRTVLRRGESLNQPLLVMPQLLKIAFQN